MKKTPATKALVSFIGLIITTVFIIIVIAGIAGTVIAILYFTDSPPFDKAASTSPSFTSSVSPTSSRTPSVTPTLTRTPTPSQTPTSSMTPSSSVTPTVTPTVTTTPTNSRTPSVTPSVSVSPVSQSSSPTKSVTISSTPSISVSRSLTPTNSPTPSTTPSITPSRSISPSPSPTPQNVDLSFLTSSQGFSILGAGPADSSGYSVAGIQDFNSDSYPDLLIGTYGPTPNNTNNGGYSFVIYGKSGGYTSSIDLRGLSSTVGFSLTNAGSLANAGLAVGSAGDFNADGIPDILIGCSIATPSSRLSAGKVYVIYGKSGGYTGINLNALTSVQGFVIYGKASYDALGVSVAYAGDINGDSLGDIVLGADGASPNGVNSAGAAVVIYGKSGGYSSTLDVAALTSAQGYIITGATPNNYAGNSVAGNADFNNDGIKDILVAAYFTNSVAGSTYALYGKNGGYTSYNLSNINAAAGVFVNGDQPYDYSGFSVASAGDFNNDGVSDMVIGAYRASPNGRNFAGQAYVVYGKSGGRSQTTIQLSTLSQADGFVIIGAEASGYCGYSVSGIGDFNGDGIADIAIGASQTSPNGRSQSGSVYIIFGRTGGYSGIDLATLTAEKGITIQGAAAGDNAGVSVSAAGDQNGDGLADVVLGAYKANVGTRSSAGKTYVVYGKSTF